MAVPTYRDPSTIYRDSIPYRGTADLVGVTVRVGGESFAFDADALSVTDRLLERSSAVVPINDSTGRHFQRGEVVEISDDYGLIFAGMVEEVDESRVGTGSTNLHVLRVVDWHSLVDRRVAAKTYLAFEAGLIIRDLIQTYLGDDGIVEGIIHTGPTLSKVVMNYVQISDAIDSLAQLAGFFWWVDERKRLHFTERDVQNAGWVQLLHDKTVRVTRRAPLYRNREYMRGGKDSTTAQVETRIGDSNARSFAMGFPLAQEPSIVRTGGAGAGVQTVGIKGVETGKQWYWNKGDPVITQDSGQAVLTAAHSITVTYYGEFPIVVLSQDNAAIALRKAIEGFGTGQVEHVEDALDTDTRSVGFEKAAALLARYSQEGTQVRFRTHRTGLRPGQVLPVDLPTHEIDGEFLVQEVQMRVQRGIPMYDAVLVSGPEEATWTQFFRELSNLGRTAADLISVGGGDAILQLTEFVSEGWTWAESGITQTVRSCSTPGNSLFPSTGLFPC